MLTRLLEGSLVASAPSRVINVSSVTHRYGLIENPANFLSRSATAVGGQYPVSQGFSQQCDIREHDLTLFPFTVSIHHN